MRRNPANPPKGTGQPIKGETPRTTQIQMRVEESTKAAFKDAAKSKGLSLSDWLLQAGLSKLVSD